MRPPPDGKMDASELAEGKKRKGKEVVDPPLMKKPKSHKRRTATKISTSASEASLGTGDKNDDESECRLEKGPRSDTGVPQVPRPEAAELGTADSGQSRAVNTLEEGANVVIDPAAGCGVVSDKGTVVVCLERSGLRVVRGQDLPIGDFYDLCDFSSGLWFSLGELRDAQNMNTSKAGSPLKG